MPHDFSYVSSHPYVRASDMNMAVARDYFRMLKSKSADVVNLITTFSNEEMFTDLTGFESEDGVMSEIKPYGVHLYVSEDELQKMGSPFTEHEIAGIVLCGSYKLNDSIDGVKVSVGRKAQTAAKHREEYLRVLREQEKKGLNCNLSMSVNDFKKALEKQRHLTFPRDEELKTKMKETHLWQVQEQYRIMYHEFEHIHNEMVGIGFNHGEDSALDETIAHLNPYTLIRGVPLGSKDSLKAVYQERMGESFDTFVSVTSAVRNSKIFKDRPFMSRVFPMVLAEVGDINNVKFHLLEIGNEVVKAVKEVHRY